MQDRPVKMYVVINDSLSPGNQAAQGVHAAFDFAYEHPQLCKSWHEDSNYLVLLAAPDENSLLALEARAKRSDLPYTLVREPDFDDQMTAIVLAPGETAQKLCANFPLALRIKEAAMV